MGTIIDMISDIEPVYFERYSYRSDMKELTICGKTVFIFANHAVAPRAWFRLGKNRPLNLISFDEHADTHSPLLVYRNSCLRRSDDRLIELLDKVKDDLSDEILAKLVEPGAYLAMTEDKTSTAGELCLRMWNDEHITTSMYLGIIQKAYICSPNADRGKKEQYRPELISLHDRILYLDKVFQESRAAYDVDHESYSQGEDSLSCYDMNNIGNKRITELLQEGLNISEPYILDIDADFFSNLGVLEREQKEYNEFAKIVQNAEGITIATEPTYVDDASERYNLAVAKYNKTYPLEKKKQHRVWDSQDVLDRLLIIIKQSLM